AAAGASLMTIDAPYTCFWAWALVLGYEAAVCGKRWAWPFAGVGVGVGILAKYTMLLWLVSFFLFLAASAEVRPPPQPVRLLAPRDNRRIFLPADCHVELSERLGDLSARRRAGGSPGQRWPHSLARAARIPGCPVRHLFDFLVRGICPGHGGSCAMERIR